MRSRDLLLLSTSTNLLYLLEEEHYQNIPILFGSISPSPAFERFVELVSGQILYAPPSLVSPHAVPDNQVHGVLRVKRVSGLRPVAPVFPLSGEEALAYSGNLINPTWMFICVSGRCNSKCVFCYTEWIRNKPQLSSALIKKAIDHAVRIPSLEAVVFSGGEPTLREDLTDLIGHAWARGFKDIGIHSNGYRLADERYLCKLRNNGLTRVLLSLHGSTKATHDSIVGHSGSFDKAVRALALLEGTRTRTTVNFVMCSANCSEVPGLISLVKSISATARVRFSFPIIEGEAYRNVADILPSFPRFIDSIALALAQNPQEKPRVEIANVPPCISDQLHMDPKYLLSQRRAVLEVSPFHEHHVERGEQLVKLQRCLSCLWADNCGGVQVPYLTQFPDAHEHVVPQGPEQTRTSRKNRPVYELR